MSESGVSMNEEEDEEEELLLLPYAPPTSSIGCMAYGRVIVLCLRVTLERTPLLSVFAHFIKFDYLVTNKLCD